MRVKTYQVHKFLQPAYCPCQPNHQISFMHALKKTLLLLLGIIAISRSVTAQIKPIIQPHTPATTVRVNSTATRFAFSNAQRVRMDSLLRAYRAKTDSIKKLSPANYQRGMLLLKYQTRQKLSTLLTKEQQQNFQRLSQDTTIVAFDIMSSGSIKQFPFPPPRGYTFTVLPDGTFANCSTLGDANNILVNAIGPSPCGYSDRSYYEIPNGFVLVTKVEEINPDCTSISGRYRFSEGQYESLSFWDFFAPRKGYFRVFAFLITDQVFNASTTRVTASGALDWIRLGANILPDAIKNKPFKPGYNCTVIVYEFKSEEANTHLLPLSSPQFTAQYHLEKSNIAQKLHP